MENNSKPMPTQAQNKSNDSNGHKKNNYYRHSKNRKNRSLKPQGKSEAVENVSASEKPVTSEQPAKDARPDRERVAGNGQSRKKKHNRQMNDRASAERQAESAKPQSNQSKKLSQKSASASESRVPTTPTKNTVGDLSFGSVLLGNDITPAIAGDDVINPALKDYVPDTSLIPDFMEDTNTKERPAPSENDTEVVGIRFKAGGKTYYFDPAGVTLKVGDHAIVETSRGLEYGEVSINNTFVSDNDIVKPLRSIIRRATREDDQHDRANRDLEVDAYKICLEKIKAHELDMKLVEASYTFDNSKLVFYFTSDGRVDFRELVKDLAGIFRTRIELRQIGIRDEAKMLGGLGACGRPLCCSSFLSNFVQVSIKMAKEQNLSLNSNKISGVCGRLMCCLKYEYDTYADELARLPAVSANVMTPDGAGTVIEVLPLLESVKVRLADKADTPPAVYHRSNLKPIQ